MSGVVTPIGVLSFPALFAPKAPAPGAKERFSATLIFDKEAQKDPAFAKLKDAAAEAAKAKWGAKLPSNMRSPFRDAGEKSYAGYEPGHIFINAWSQSQPGVVDGKRNEILEAKEVFAGQLARFRVKAFAYEAQGNKGVAFGLEHVQIVKKDAPRIDGKIAANMAFDDMDLSEDKEMVADSDAPF